MKRIIKRFLSFFALGFKRFRFHKIGKNFIVGRGLIVNGKRKERITIGDNVTIGRYSRLGNTSNYGSGIAILDGSMIGNFFTAIDGDITVGKKCLIASYVTIVAANHKLDPTIEKGYSNPNLDYNPVVIGDECWIGERVVILPGVTIGNRSIIGAGSVVSKSVPPYCMAVGNPARIIKRFNQNTHQWERI